VHTGIVAVRADPSRDALVVDVSTSLAPVLLAIVGRVRRMFDTGADPATIAAHLAGDPLLFDRVAARPALRVMGAFEPFEWATRAVLGQQISVRAALTLGARLVETFGRTVPLESISGFADAPTRTWPTAADLASATDDRIASIGLTKTRARTLRGLSEAVADGRIRLDGSEDEAALRERLLAVPGIGPWTADYIAMRALAWPDAFPAGDLALRKALGGLSTKACEERAEAWRPWRAYAAAHLWMGSAEETGT
jgi:AraC family transcriptional regulator, regulatory protein of adaptative response / DNA-3-methyladenine glycosylase II